MFHKIVNKVAYGKNRRYSKMNEINKPPEQILKKFEIWSKSQDQTEREKKRRIAIVGQCIIQGRWQSVFSSSLVLSAHSDMGKRSSCEAKWHYMPAQDPCWGTCAVSSVWSWAGAGGLATVVTEAKRCPGASVGDGEPAGHGCNRHSDSVLTESKGSRPLRWPLRLEAKLQVLSAARRGAKETPRGRDWRGL